MGMDPIGGTFFSAPQRERPERKTKETKRNLRTTDTSVERGRNGASRRFVPEFSKGF